MKQFRIQVKHYLNGEYYGGNDYYIFADNVLEAEQEALTTAQCEDAYEFDSWEIGEVEDLGEE